MFGWRGLSNSDLLLLPLLFDDGNQTKVLYALKMPATAEEEEYLRVFTGLKASISVLL